MPEKNGASSAGDFAGGISGAHPDRCLGTALFSDTQACPHPGGSKRDPRPDDIRWKHAGTKRTAKHQ